MYKNWNFYFLNLCFKKLKRNLEKKRIIGTAGNMMALMLTVKCLILLTTSSFFCCGRCTAILIMMAATSTILLNEF